MKFMVKDIILLRLNFKNNIIQENSAVMTTVDVAMTVKNIVSIVNNNCIDNANIANDNYVQFKRLA